MTPDDPRHGTVNGYSNLLCRCQFCRAAWAEHIHDYRVRRLASGEERLLKGRFVPTESMARYREARQR